MNSILTVPKLSLVVLVGCSGSGKSTFARKHFLATEIVSSDTCRGIVSDDENDQFATPAAFELLHFIAKKRLAAGRLTVVDATNVQPEARKPLIALAREWHAMPVAIVLALPEDVCRERNRARPDRAFGAHVLRQQASQLRRSIRHLKDEGFRHVYVLSTPEDIDTAQIERKPLWNDRRDDHGPFDVIGDVHGCYDELVALLEKLGYRLDGTPEAPRCTPPDGRKAVFLGDLVDRGPRIPDVLRLVMAMVREGRALCVPGNHEAKLLRKLRGKDVKPTHGLAQSLEQLEPLGAAFRDEVADFIDGLVSHYVLDDGKLVVAHAGLKEELQGRASGAVRGFCLYGETTGENDEYGLPIRYDWAADYRGSAMVVYGHTPVVRPEWVNRTLCVDTGCVFGGALTALRYPEREIVQVEAARMYYEPARPLAPPREARADEHALDWNDVAGKRIVSTRHAHTVTVREAHAAPAIEIMSRYAVDPRWLIYLPPTMSPSETAKDGPLLERPREAFDYFRSQGLARVVCEQKHMGSRAVVIVCRSAEAAAARFGVRDGRDGVVYTRTGRPFFNEPELERGLLGRVRAAIEGAGLWDELRTDWLCLDAELMPWSQKARELIRSQYAAVGAAGTSALAAAVAALAKTPGAEELRSRFEARREAVVRFRRAYRGYCWETATLDDLELAPFHVLAAEGRVFVDQAHTWHMQWAARLAAADTSGLLLATPCLEVDLHDEASVAGATRWWTELTERGGEGMVVKPLDWLARGPKGLVQPALKCRGPEYLRIIYGPEYDAPEHLERLRSRNVHVKRGLAIKEYALGLEALHRFVEREPLHRVHECAFGVLALETEPVDPRL